MRQFSGKKKNPLLSSYCFPYDLYLILAQTYFQIGYSKDKNKDKYDSEN